MEKIAILGQPPGRF